MLAQLVCIDRRYQRMNCFNIREVEALLKRRFFYDLTNDREFTTLLDKSMIGLKYKLNDFNFNHHHSNLVFNYGPLLNNHHSFNDISQNNSKLSFKYLPKSSITYKTLPSTAFINTYTPKNTTLLPLFNDFNIINSFQAFPTTSFVTHYKNINPLTFPSIFFS